MRWTNSYKEQLLKAIESVNLAAVEQAIAWFQEARDSGQCIFVCGNGGSAATASHFACDVLKGASTGHRKRIRIVAFTDSPATITAYSNDLSFDFSFVEQLKNFASPGDVFMALSGSGRSRNVIKAMEYAVAHGCRTIALTGRDGGKLASITSLNINVAEPHMGRIEDAHLMICHMIAYGLMDTRAGYPLAMETATKAVDTGA